MRRRRIYCIHCCTPRESQCLRTSAGYLRFGHRKDVNRGRNITAGSRGTRDATRVAHSLGRHSCHAELRLEQFEKIERLEPAIALISAVATTLLRVRDAARAPDAETRPAS
jgi:hypothetical protein